MLFFKHIFTIAVATTAIHARPISGDASPIDSDALVPDSEFPWDDGEAMTPDSRRPISHPTPKCRWHLGDCFKNDCFPEFKTPADTIGFCTVGWYKDCPCNKCGSGHNFMGRCDANGCNGKNDLCTEGKYQNCPCDDQMGEPFPGIENPKAPWNNCNEKEWIC